MKVFDEPDGEDVLRIRRTAGEKTSSEELRSLLLFPIDRPVDTRTVANVDIVNSIKSYDVQAEARIRGRTATLLSVVT
jgi:hypothetical protein